MNDTLQDIIDQWEMGDLTDEQALARIVEYNYLAAALMKAIAKGFER